MATFFYILHLLLLLLLPFPNTSVIASASEPLGFTVTLVHRDNPASPLYDPSSSPAQRAQQAILHSRRRSQYLASTFNNTKSSTTVMTSYNVYLMLLYIGTPPRPYWLSIDTGSDLTWVACEPCDTCFTSRALMFKPLQSSSYHSQSCTSRNCRLVRGRCDDDQLCLFNRAYADESSIQGILSSETVNFDRGFDRRARFSNLIIGCVHHEASPHPHLLLQPGLVGLSPSSNSFVNQIGSIIDYRFAYCLPPVTGESNGWIKFGSDAIQFPQGSELQVISMGQHGDEIPYFTVILKDISVRHDRVNIEWRPPQVPNQDARILIVDSGSETMYLAPYVYDQVKQDVENAVDAEGFISHGQLCYQVFGEDPYEGLPHMTLHFASADWMLQPDQVFRYVQESGKVCLAFQPATYWEVGILGGLAQQNKHIMFDVRTHLLYFASTDCGGD